MLLHRSNVMTKLLAIVLVVVLLIYINNVYVYSKTILKSSTRDGICKCMEINLGYAIAESNKVDLDYGTLCYSVSYYTIWNKYPSLALVFIAIVRVNNTPMYVLGYNVHVELVNTTLLYLPKNIMPLIIEYRSRESVTNNNTIYTYRLFSILDMYDNELQPFNITLKIVLRVRIEEISIIGRPLKIYTLLLSKEVPVSVDIRYIDLYLLKYLLT